MFNSIMSRRDVAKLGVCAVGGAAAFAFSGCADRLDDLDNVIGAVEDDAASVPNSERAEIPAAGDLGAVGNFSVRTAGALVEGADALNLCYSPASAFFALALAALGVEGVTQSELLDVLDVPDAESLADACRTVIESFDREFSDSRIAFANSIWSDDGWAFADAYAKRVEECVGAEAGSVDFGSSSANKAIADWVRDKTEGLLAPSFSFDAETAAVLLNALYFKAAWQSDMFGEGSVVRGTFHAASADKEVDFIHDSSYDDYRVFKGVVSATLPFSHGAAITFLLPDEGADPREILSDADALAGVLDAERTGHGDIYWAIPKFDLKNESMSLKPTLEKLGVKALFDGSVLGDFDSMLQPSDGTAAAPGMDPFVSDVVQGTRISLDEFGVEAAAYTYEALVGAAEDLEPPRPLRMVLDRPFAFVIRGYEGTPLFIGVVDDPAA